MIVISDWIAIAIIAAIVLFFIFYLTYIIISRSHPQVMEFNNKINPNDQETILTIRGSGIIKRIEMQTSQNNSSIVLTVDKTAYTSFNLSKESNNTAKENPNDQKDNQLKLEANLDRHFLNEFSLFVDNRSEETLTSIGKIYYEIKKPATK